MKQTNNIITLKDYLKLDNEIIKLKFDDFWYYHTPEEDVLLNVKTKQRIFLHSQEEHLSKQLGLNLYTDDQLRPLEPYFTVYLDEDQTIQVYSEMNSKTWEKRKHDHNNQLTKTWTSQSLAFHSIYEYNADGYVTHYQTSTGYYEKTTYNELNQKIKYETSEGIINQFVYDSKGNMIFSLYSDKTSESYESESYEMNVFDDLNRLIYRADNKGYSIANKYNEKNELSITKGTNNIIKN